MENTIYPCLWFDGKAKEAAEYYLRVFDHSRIISDNQTVVMLELSGQEFMFLNGGPQYTINPSISFYVVCEELEEVELLWKKLMEGGTALMPLDGYAWSQKYGWVQDRYGVNWQLSLGRMVDVGQKYTPVLMFTGEQNGRAEEAIHFYVSVFDGSSITGIARYEKDGNDTEGHISHAQFNLGKQVVMAMDSSQSHAFTFNEAISLVVECKNQQEIDYYWDRFTAEGEEVQCGWLKDKFGVSWQIVPAVLKDLTSDPDRFPRVMQAILPMKKIDIKTLVNA